MRLSTIVIAGRGVRDGGSAVAVLGVRAECRGGCEGAFVVVCVCVSVWMCGCVYGGMHGWVLALARLGRRKLTLRTVPASRTDYRNGGGRREHTLDRATEDAPPDIIQFTHHGASRSALPLGRTRRLPEAGAAHASAKKKKKLLTHGRSRRADRRRRRAGSTGGGRRAALDAH